MNINGMNQHYPPDIYLLRENGSRSITKILLERGDEQWLLPADLFQSFQVDMEPNMVEVELTITPMSIVVADIEDTPTDNPDDLNLPTLGK